MSLSAINEFDVEDSPTMEPRITVLVAFLVVAVGSASFSRRDLLPSNSTSILGSTLRARLLGEGCVSLVAEHGKGTS